MRIQDNQISGNNVCMTTDESGYQIYAWFAKQISRMTGNRIHRQTGYKIIR